MIMIIKYDHLSSLLSSDRNRMTDTFPPEPHLVFHSSNSSPLEFLSLFLLSISLGWRVNASSAHPFFLTVDPMLDPYAPSTQTTACSPPHTLGRLDKCLPPSKYNTGTHISSIFLPVKKCCCTEQWQCPHWHQNIVTESILKHLPGAKWSTYCRKSKEAHPGRGQ